MGRKASQTDAGRMLIRSIGLGALVALVGGACATGTPPGELIAAAETSISSAQQQGPSDRGAVVLRKAEDKLAQARNEAQKGDKDRARRLATEADLEGQLAAALTGQDRSAAILAEVQKNVNELGDELKFQQQNGGPR